MGGSVFLEDEDATLALGASLAGTGLASELVFLHGDLGAGKTTLVRGFLRALGHVGAVKSPTYTLLETYELPRGGDSHGTNARASAASGGGCSMRGRSGLGPEAKPVPSEREVPDTAMGRLHVTDAPAVGQSPPPRSGRVLHVYHFDFYRIVDPRELGYMGIDELMGAPAVKLVEWPSHAGDRLPKPDIEVRLRVTGAHRSADIVDHR